MRSPEELILTYVRLHDERQHKLLDERRMQPVPFPDPASLNITSDERYALEQRMAETCRRINLAPIPVNTDDVLAALKWLLGGIGYSLAYTIHCMEHELAYSIEQGNLGNAQDWSRQLMELRRMDYGANIKKYSY